MDTAPSPTTEKPPKLRWYQWRLRSLFILTLLVAIGMSYVAVTMRNQRKQKAVAEVITKAGGTVQCDRTLLGIFLRDDSLVSVPYVRLDRGAVTDAVMVHLQELSQLQTLSFINTQVTDAQLVHLQGLSQLHRLDLRYTKITDAGLVHLQGLSQLQVLLIHNTKITDEGVKKLKQALPNCRNIFR